MIEASALSRPAVDADLVPLCWLAELPVYPTNATSVLRGLGVWIAGGPALPPIEIVVAHDGRPLRVVDGNHRLHYSRQLDLSAVWTQCFWLDHGRFVRAHGEPRVIDERSRRELAERADRERAEAEYAARQAEPSARIGKALAERRRWFETGGREGRLVPDAELTFDFYLSKPSGSAAG